MQLRNAFLVQNKKKESYTEIMNFTFGMLSLIFLTTPLFYYVLDNDI